MLSMTSDHHVGQGSRIFRIEVLTRSLRRPTGDLGSDLCQGLARAEPDLAEDGRGKPRRWGFG